MTYFKSRVRPGRFRYARERVDGSGGFEYLHPVGMHWTTSLVLAEPERPWEPCEPDEVLPLIELHWNTSVGGTHMRRVSLDQYALRTGDQRQISLAVYIREFLSDVERQFEAMSNPDAGFTVPQFGHILGSLDMAHRLMEHLVDAVGSGSLQTSYKASVPAGGWVRRARNHFAHWDERVETTVVNKGDHLSISASSSAGGLQEVYVLGETYRLDAATQAAIVHQSKNVIEDFYIERDGPLSPERWHASSPDKSGPDIVPR